MGELVPAEATRDRMLQVIGLSFLFPGLGHLVTGARGLGLAWMLIANAALLSGFHLAGYTQFDYGFSWALGGIKLVVALPESLNFGGTLLIGNLASSVEAGGSYIENLPNRQLGYLLSGDRRHPFGCFGAACRRHGARENGAEPSRVVCTRARSRCLPCSFRAWGTP